MVYKHTIIALLVTMMILLFGPSNTVASPLDEWRPWLSEKHPNIDCPWLMTGRNNRACVWPGQLDLQVNRQGASFFYRVDIFQKHAFIRLPGNAEHWPKAVSVNDKPAAVIERKGLPYLSLAAGKHIIEGKFNWQKLPGQLATPKDVAIVSLSVEGKAKPLHQRNGYVIFAGTKAPVQKKTSDSLTIEVYRLLSDGVPLTLETLITLSVSGKPREVSFGRVMLEGTQLTKIRSAIPARIDADGSMRAQVSAGQHSIRVYSRFSESPIAIASNKASNNWPEYEYISFVSDTAIRQTKLAGPISIDTSQINLPKSWADYPTYRLDHSTPLTITTEYRGDYAPAANELNIHRDLWLDFNGKGLTALDRINGEMTHGWRLNAADGNHIGRATVDQAPVLITQDKGRNGIEVRSPTIALEAVTRSEAITEFSASGWDANADSYRATLHLPPGWRALHASGVDHIRGTWLSQWDLWDVFLMLIIISATRKLMGNVPALLGGAAFLIALHEASTPLLMTPVLLITIALLPLVSGRIQSLLRTSGLLFSAALLLGLISFAVSTFRVAIYPSLERPMMGTYNQQRHISQEAYLLEEVVVEAMADSANSLQKMKSSGLAPRVNTPQHVQKSDKSLYQVTENDRVQTGPGLPTWTWQTIHLEASGPVAASQQLTIYYSSPLFTALWRVIAVLLVALYSFAIIAKLVRLCGFKANSDKPSSATGNGSKPSATASASVMLAVLVMLTLSASPNAIARDYPPKYLLDELEARLTKAPDCLPGCASLTDGRIVVSGQNLTLSFNAYVDADIALPLPNSGDGLQITNITENTVALALLKQRDKRYVRLQKGHHKLTIKGKLTGDQATLNFTQPIHHLVVEAPQWIIEGLVDQRLRNNTLTLRSVDKQINQQVDTLKADPAPAFVKINRRLVFGKKWSIQTTVSRIAPEQGAISVPISLLANEQPLQDLGAVNDGVISVQLGQRQRQTSWTSTLEPVEHLTLKASQQPHAIEQWSFTPSSLWRLQYDGVAAIKPRVNANAFEPVFKPWPGETLSITVRKPEGVAGPTHTVENALLNVVAGNPLQRSTLTMVIRASLGEDYIITLPEQAEVIKFSVDGRAMNTPANNRVKVPLTPGSQSVEVEFQIPTAIGIVSSTPAVALPGGGANIRIHYTLPRDRWPLYISGPAIGPAMLYWGVLCVIVLAALALPHLARKLGFDIPVSPLGWLLLGLGLSTVNGYGVLIIAAMFFMLAARKQLIKPDQLAWWKFNLLQCAIVFWVVVAVFSMLSAIPMGLLSIPEMKVVGNGSASHYYQYYQDIVGSEGLPSATVISVPMLAYRSVMLLWSLWLSTQLITWAGWAWQCFLENGHWQSKANSTQADDTSKST